MNPRPNLGCVLLLSGLTVLSGPATAAKAVPPPSTTARPKPAPPKQPLEAAGILGSVEASSHTVILRRQDGALLTLLVSDQTPIQRDGRPATLADLHVDDLIHALYQLQGSQAQAIRIEVRSPNRVQGTITALDASGFVTITTESGNAVTLKITDATQVVLHGPAAFSGLQVNMRAIATFEPGTDVRVARRLVAGSEVNEAEVSE
jgi:hypothetical protein